MSSEVDGNTIEIDDCVDEKEKVQINASYSDKHSLSSIKTSDPTPVPQSSLPVSEVLSPEPTENQDFVDLNSVIQNTKSINGCPVLLTLDSNIPNISEGTDNVNTSELITDTVDTKTDNDYNDLKESYLNKTSLDENRDNSFVKIECFANSANNINNDLQCHRLDEQEVAFPDFDLDLKMNINKTIVDDSYEANAIILNTTVISTDNINNDLQPQQFEAKKIDKLPERPFEKSKLEKSLTFSTMSLDDENTDISSTTHSKSAENVSLIQNNQIITGNGHSIRDINREKILNEFDNRKANAAAKQKLSPEIPHNLTETLQHIDAAKYSRIPKEILTQDLGSLVKNVHGIFSTVSGSLKNAYNQTHRAPKLPVKNVTIPLPSSTVMDNIFEDTVEKNSRNESQTCMESPVKISVTEMKIEDGSNKDEKVVSDDKNFLKQQVERLEKMLLEQKMENSQLKDRVKQKTDELNERDESFKEIQLKMESLTKRVEIAERDKDAAVMRYASVECAAIEAKRAAEKALAAERAALNEMELLNNKLKSAHSEKARICQLYDDKCHELANSERELCKVREDIKELEGRLKWTQSKLRMEMDAYKDSAERAEKLSQQVSSLEAARDAAVANAVDSTKVKQLEKDLNESQAALILCRHDKQDLERRLAATANQLEACTREKDSATACLASANAELERLKECNLRLEEEAAELAALRAQAALADTLSAQLQRESERALEAEEALSRERARADTCARREAAALAHAAALTAQDVQQRASCTDEHNKAQALEMDNASLREQITSLEEELTRLKTALSEETEKRNRETRTLARKVAEITEEAAEAKKTLEWEKGESSLLKKKHANAIKELNRELNRALKRCEQLEAKLPPPETRTGSVSPSNSVDSTMQHSDENTQQCEHTDTLPDIQVREPDRQALIERIVTLQRAAARRAERCEFLEEHSKQLTNELRGKSRLLRHLLCSLPAGAVASTKSDAHKKEIARLGGGAMAAVWGGDATGMTLELSLEMNNKLQAVLEDALLKNITLKENMDTLGEEIARLKKQNNSKSN